MAPIMLVSNTQYNSFEAERCLLLENHLVCMSTLPFGNQSAPRPGTPVRQRPAWPDRPAPTAPTASPGPW